MDRFLVETFPQWPYDEALSFMAEAQERVLKNPSQVIVGIGSHEESVITLGRNRSISIIHAHELHKRSEVIVREIDRGGGATAHEPGQVVLYPLLNIKLFRLAPKDLTTILENTLLSFLRRFGVEGTRSEGPGIFIEGQKIGFIGLRIKDDVSSHGMAVNIFNEGDLFRSIDPCGVAGLPITSLYKHRSLPPLDEIFWMMVEDFKVNFLEVTSLL